MIHIGYQGLLLFLFGLIFIIINILIAWQLSDSCNLSDSENKLTQHLLTIMNVLCGILMFIGIFIGLSFKYKHFLKDYFNLTDDSLMWFYKYGNFFPAILFLVCSSYLLSIVNKLNCTDIDANSSIQQLCIGILVMSIIYFITACILFYNFHSETYEQIIEKADLVSKEVAGYTEESIKDIKLTDVYKSNIEDLNKALELVDINTNIDYNQKIQKLNKYINIAENRNYAKNIYKNIQGTKLENQLAQINQIVCNSTTHNEEEKVEMLKELNRLNSKLPKECENAPEEYKTKTNSDRLKQELEEKQLQKQIKDLSNPITESKSKSQLEILTDQIAIKELQKKLKEIDSPPEEDLRKLFKVPTDQEKIDNERANILAQAKHNLEIAQINANVDKIQSNRSQQNKMLISPSVASPLAPRELVSRSPTSNNSSPTEHGQKLAPVRVRAPAPASVKSL